MSKQFAWTAKRPHTKHLRLNNTTTSSSANQTSKHTHGIRRLYAVVKKYSAIIFLCIILSTSIVAISFHPFFQLSTITIHGTVRLSEETVSSFVQKQLQETFFLLPKSSIFLFSESDMEKQLIKGLPIEEANVRVSFPNDVEITIREKQSKVLVSNGIDYVLVDERGMLLEKVGKVNNEEWKTVTTKNIFVTTTIRMVSGTPMLSTTTIAITTTTKVYIPNITAIHSAFSNFPVLVSLTATTTESFWTTQQTASITQWMSVIDKNTPYSWVQTLYMQDVEGESLTAYLKNGRTKIYIKKNISELEAYEAFEAIERATNPETITSIDLRYLPKIFWK